MSPRMKSIFYTYLLRHAYLTVTSPYNSKSYMNVMMPYTLDILALLKLLLVYNTSFTGKAYTKMLHYTAILVSRADAINRLIENQPVC